LSVTVPEIVTALARAPKKEAKYSRVNSRFDRSHDDESFPLSDGLHRENPAISRQLSAFSFTSRNLESHSEAKPKRKAGTEG